MNCGYLQAWGSVLVQIHVAGRSVRESTKQGNDKVARQMEAAHRTSLAKGEVGIRDTKVVPMLIEFCEKRFEPWIESTTARKPHSGHVEPSSLKKQHRKALRLAGAREFVLYSLRHTFLTRLGESGCDAWTLARIAGHSSITISAKYVHPSENAVLDAVERLGGHKTGHSQNQAELKVSDGKSLSA